MHFHRKDRTTKLAAMSIIICLMVTFPLMMIPVGLRRGTSAGVLVKRAYADTYPYDDQDEILVEDWAFTEEVPNGENQDDGMIHLGEGEMVTATYNDDAGHKEEQYTNIMNAQIVQTYDSSDLPIEILDTSAFVPTNEDYYIKTSNTILKKTPNMDSETVAEIDRSTRVTQISQGDTWSLITTREGVEGYVLTASLSYSMVFNEIDRTVWVDASGLKLRAQPSTDAEIIKELSRYTKLHCSGIANDQWYHVTTEDGTEGYVYVSYTTTSAPPTPTPKPTPKPTPVPSSNNSSNSKGKSSSSGGGSNSGSGSEKSNGKSSNSGNSNPAPEISGANGESIVNIAKSMLGVDYDWQGESRNGVDCSGLVVYCYRQIKIEIPHYSNDIRYVGTGVSRSEIQPGDVIVYDLKGGDGVADHVAIYAGDGKVIHASSSKDEVVWGNMDMGSILTIRRFVG